MAQSPRKIPLQGGPFFQGVANHVKLIWLLLQDPRVNPLLKLIPIGSLLYLFFPIDIPGPFDDAAVIWFSTYLFIEMCPPEVVAEHRAELDRTVPAAWHDVDEKPPE